MALTRREQERDLTRWSPGFSMPIEFSTMRREIDRLFDRMLGGVSAFEGAYMTMPVDIVEREDDYLVKVDLPGVRKEDVKITLTNDVLTIRGERRQAEKIEEKDYHRMERTEGVFQRSFTLPSAVESDNIEAIVEDGVLSITIPKAEEAKPREIQVRMKGKAH